MTPADVPASRTDAELPPRAPATPRKKRSEGRHRRLFRGRLDHPPLGNASDAAWAQNYAVWKANFWGWNAADFGWGADATENILWRLKNGELDGVNPKVIVILAGTNNVGAGESADEVARGIEALVRTCQQKAPKATVVLTAIFPRNDDITLIPTINEINERLKRFADGRRVRFLNVNAGLADASGKLYEGMTVDGLHPTPKGFQVWADGLKPILKGLLGPPAATDHAPPPTGDPSATPPRIGPPRRRGG